MYTVCANYCNSTVILDTFKTEEEAENFMKHDYILIHSDEFADEQEDDIIHPDEMFISNDDEIPFYEPLVYCEKYNEVFIDSDDLPF